MSKTIQPGELVKIIAVHPTSSHYTGFKIGWYKSDVYEVLRNEKSPFPVPIRFRCMDLKVVNTLSFPFNGIKRIFFGAVMVKRYKK